jgi:glycine/D-amino acid oxidase-like deaminating enzyme
MTMPPTSLWWDSLPNPLQTRESLNKDIDVDVAIIGAGYTGLWSAYYLLKKSPGIKIALLESNVAGFGASGRNGGWCSALFPVGLDKLAQQSNKEKAIRMQQIMFETVDEVGNIIKNENIDAEWQKGGSFSIARDKIQLKRAIDEVNHYKEWGFKDSDYTFLDEHSAKSRINASNIKGATFTPHCAAINPAKLVRSLAEIVEAKGAQIFENTKVLSFSNNVVRTPYSNISYKYIINATEGYRSNLPGLKRTSIPVYSLMIATDVLSEKIWNEIGLNNRETFADFRNLIIYGQRTKDNRFAFGGRGAPYHFGSKIDNKFDIHKPTHDELLRTLVELFPVIKGVKVTHAWGGPLSIARDWAAHVSLDVKSGIASAGGYVGDGVGTSNLAGRTLADLILKNESEIVSMPWVNHKSKKWDIEPFRWIGVNGSLKLAGIADIFERKFKKETFITWLLNKLRGH